MAIDLHALGDAIPQHSGPSRQAVAWTDWKRLETPGNVPETLVSGQGRRKLQLVAAMTHPLLALWCPLLVHLKTLRERPPQKRIENDIRGT
eukprot:9785815-Lingulodinium_polyedra.AAC.1